MIARTANMMPIWMNGNNTQALKRTTERWWEQVFAWLHAPHELGDAMTAPLAIVDLYAYQRGIDRQPRENERLYRLRVQHALINAKEAGTYTGIQRIFARLEMPVYGLAERLAGHDWDMIKVEADLQDYLAHSTGLHIVLEAYRRTCRRWLVEVQAPTLSATDDITNAVMTIAEPTGTDIVARNTELHVAACLTILECA